MYGLVVYLIFSELNVVHNISKDSERETEQQQQQRKKTHENRIMPDSAINGFVGKT